MYGNNQHTAKRNSEIVTKMSRIRTRQYVSCCGKYAEAGSEMVKLVRDAYVNGWGLTAGYSHPECWQKTLDTIQTRPQSTPAWGAR
jgi:hypothetical protein